MPYKISGYLQDPSAKILVLKETDLSVETTQDVTLGNYEVLDLEAGKKVVVASSPEGEIVGFGDVESIKYSIASDRGVFGGGITNSKVIDYIMISSLGNAVSFGNLHREKVLPASTSNLSNERALVAGTSSGIAWMDYITITSLGDASRFGNLTVGRNYCDGASNGLGDRGVFGPGHTSTSAVNVMDYITISSLGDASDFGDATLTRYAVTATSNNTGNRGLFASGVGGGANIIEYITITSLSNATNFGELDSQTNVYMSACSNRDNNRALFGAGQADATIEYVTMTSLGNASDFGDLTAIRYQAAATSNGTDERAVWGGGRVSGGARSSVTYVTINSLGNSIEFGDLTMARQGLTATSDT